MAAHHTSYEPLPRSTHAAVAVDNKLHMWGGLAGYGEKSREVTPKIVEVFDISTELWKQKPTHGTPPPGLWGTAYTVVGLCLFVFGGYDGVSRHNTLFKLELDPHNFQWEQVQVSNPSSGPQKKDGCGMVSYGDNQLVIFAGYTDSAWTDELHVFDLDKGEYSLCTKPQSKQLYGSCGAVRKFRCYVWSDCYQILSGYNQGCIDHKLDSISPWYTSSSRLW